MIVRGAWRLLLIAFFFVTGVAAAKAYPEWAQFVFLTAGALQYASMRGDLDMALI